MHIYESTGSVRYQIYSILVSKVQAEMSKISWWKRGIWGVKILLNNHSHFNSALIITKAGWYVSNRVVMFSVHSRILSSAHLNEVGNIYSCMWNFSYDFSIFQDSCKRQSCDIELSWMIVQGGIDRSLPFDAVPLACQRVISPTILFDLFFCL